MKELSEPIIVKLVAYDQTTINASEIVFTAVLGEGEAERKGILKMERELFYKAFGNMIGLD